MTGRGASYFRNGSLAEPGALFVVRDALESVVVVCAETCTQIAADTTAQPSTVINNGQRVLLFSWIIISLSLLQPTLLAVELPAR